MEFTRKDFTWKSTFSEWPLIKRYENGVYRYYFLSDNHLGREE